jgi:histidinol dehydrogenase
MSIRVVERSQASRYLKRRVQRLDEAEKIVRPILEAVRRDGDKALLQYARRFDGLPAEAKSVRVAEKEAAAMATKLSPAFRAAVRAASANIKAFARAQLPKPFVRRYGGGITAGMEVRPLGCIGAYVPSGRYPLPSTLLMTVLPAQVAGVVRTCVTSPRMVDEIFGTAHLLGVKDLFRMGGAQAIAAFAFGTKTVPRADRIVGPGNIYVAAAKKLVSAETGIDFVAGPTEVLLIAEDGDPEYLAADLLAQAEHDTDAAAILLTSSRRLALAVRQAVAQQLETLPTAATAKVALQKNSAIVVTSSLAESIDIANQFAPEHLSVGSRSILKQINHAGAVFVGHYSPEAAGDYASGPNHVLPTSGAARLRGGLSAADYVKCFAWQEITPRALRALEPTVTTLARAEGLEAHARSIEVRTRKKR